MRATSYDAVVVGAGVVGAWCFATLCRTRRRALLIDAGRVGGGITAHSGAIVRAAHGDPGQARAAAQGCHAYDRAVRDSGGAVGFAGTGYLHFAEGHTLREIADHLADLGRDCEILAGRDLARFAGLDVQASEALFEPGAGYLDSAGLLSWLIAEGVRHGGAFADGVALDKPLVQANRVTGVETSHGTFATGALVLASGAATPSLLEGMGVRDHGLWNQIIQVVRFVGGRPLEGAPCFYDDVLDVNGRWCPVTGGLYVGYPTNQPVTGPARDFPVDPEHADRALTVASRRFGFLHDARPAGGVRHVDCYSNSPGGTIGRPSDAPEGLLVASGFSGGGYKMAPYAAQAIAERIA